MNEPDIRKYLSKIVGSESFSRSDIYKRLLQYLTESTLKGENPKEFTVGLEVFNKQVDDPVSSKVRVYVHKLRKRLDAYYDKEGKDDQIRFIIPKGGYTVEFKHKKDIHTGKRNNNTWFYLLFIALLLTANGVFLLVQKSKKSWYEKTVIWNDLITNNKSTIIVAGDFFVYQNDKMNERDGRVRNIRDIKINSEEQLRTYVAQNDSLRMEDIIILSESTTYMPRDALYSLQYLIPLLDRSNVEFQIILSSNFDWERYYDQNIIYIGAFKNMKSLSLLADKLNVRYDHQNDVLHSTYRGELRTYENFMAGDERTIDYTLAAKMPGPKNNVIYFFVSNNDIGCIASVKYFTQPDSIKGFQRKYLQDANYFRAMYRTEGISKTDISFQLIEFEPIVDSTLHAFWNK